MLAQQYGERRDRPPEAVVVPLSSGERRLAAADRVGEREDGAVLYRIRSRLPGLPAGAVLVGRGGLVFDRADVCPECRRPEDEPHAVTCPRRPPAPPVDGGLFS